MNKIYILDTNIVLYDYNCLSQFGDSDIGIPITVLEEIDSFKKGRGQLNFNAREFARQLDILSDSSANDQEALFKEGASLGENRGKLRILSEVEFKGDFGKKFLTRIEDHFILSAAYNFVNDPKNRDKKVIFVTKDVNLRIKARSIGLQAEDYQAGKISNIADLTPDVEEVLVDSELINSIYQKKYIEASLFKEYHQSYVDANLFYILKSEDEVGTKTALTRLNANSQQLELIPNEIGAYGIKPRNKEQRFALNALLDDNIKLVTITGTAGTGKTLLTLAASLERRKNYKQIFLSRPIVPLSNKDIGYLPGTAKNKIEPYMQPLYDNLRFIQNNFNETDEKYKIIDELQKYEKLVISPLAYIRGRTLSNVYVIVDETQNLTPHEVKTIITRAGEGTKIVLTGDVYQIDTPFLDSESNGLAYVIDKMQNQKIYANITLRKGERSVLSELGSTLL